MVATEQSIKTPEDFGYGFETEPQITFGDRHTVGRELSRFLFFAGDVLGVDTKFEREDLKAGGEVVDNPCLWRFRRFLRKCVITPFEVGGLPTPPELVPEGAELITMSQEGDPAPARGVYGNLSAAPLLGLKVYPGEQIVTILNGSLNRTGNLKKGIVEIEDLRGGSFESLRESGLQGHFFPSVPVKLREVEAMIRAGLAKDSAPLIQHVGGNMLSSVEQFREFGKAQIEREHANLRKGTLDSGFTYTYSPFAETLLEQLEVPRQDQGLKEVADLNQNMTAALLKALDGKGDTQVAEAIAKLAANQETLTAALLKIIESGEKEKAKK